MYFCFARGMVASHRDQLLTAALFPTHQLREVNQISNILYSDKNAFIRLPQLHIAGLLYSGLEPPISSKLLLPKLQYNLGSLMVSLDV